jgi:hypothetical protein
MGNDEVQEMVAAAKAVLAGEIDMLAGCHWVAYALRCADLGGDPEHSFLSAVSSECDHLPIHGDRQHWNAEVLKRKDEEIARVSDFYREEILASCRRLVER